ncbi:hypothetical protein EQP59_09100 [Ornithobacterium rhinotracheale]|uniref:Uncharacterized protein n=1 Tax=Ornithobacterium rhinotracheale TaxID=28251 RepID=A0A3R5UYK7_ORNRH|nr:hypothetical protein [Ornithobacterium rhinotracheale]QAR31485.1 hypothetical protein EQP59_09100 [Ornithobacterium rhinotracheale]
MTKRDKKRVKKGLFILLLVWLLFRLTKKTSIKEKVSTGDNSLLPLDTNKFKEPVSLPKVEKPKFDKVFAKGGSAVRNEKAFAHKVEDMMNAERRKGKIPVKSDVVKQVQREQAPDVSPAEPCVECEEEKRRRAQEEMPKPVPAVSEPLPCNPLSFEPRAYENHCDGGMSLLAQKENVFVYINGPHKRVVNKNGKVARVDAGVNVHILQNNHYVDVDGDFSTYDGTYSINQNGIIE